MFKYSLANNLENNNEQNSSIAQNQEIVTFHSDENPLDVKFYKHVDINTDLLTSSADGMAHDIKAFLGRPVQVVTGTWASTDLAGTIISTIQLPKDPLTLAMSKAKVSGFYGFRAKAVVRLQVNANRFQMGRLFMNFFPQAEQSVNRFAAASENLVFFSQLPRVDYDASSDTEVILEVPYINNQLYYNLQDDTGKMGTISLVVYSPLDAASGELSANYNIWVHFEDIHLEYPVIPTGSFVAQSGVDTTTGVGQVLGVDESTQTMARPIRIRDPSTNEQIQFGNGPVSGFLGKVARVADDLIDVPMLTWIAAPVSWAAALGSKIASAFGFSNPLNNHAVNTVSQMPMARSMNCSGFDNSYNMGLFEDNAVEILPGFAGTDVDEMAFSYPLSIPTYFETFTWADTDALGTRLYLKSLGPSDFTYSENISFNSTTVASQITTPLSFIASFFKEFKGSIRLTFKVVKTEFHSGRLMIAFIPGDVANGSITYANTQFVHKEILDLRLTNQVTLTCPFVATRPYLPITSHYGKLAIFVVNELRHPDTVPNTLPILVEVSADKDMEFAVPVETTYELISNYTISEDLLEAQVADLKPVVKTSIANVLPGTHQIGSAKVVSDNHSSAKACIGEKVVSFRQLLKKSVPYYCYQTDNTHYYNAVRVNANVQPARNATSWTTNFYPDYMQLVGSLYSYQRGSIRIKAYNKIYTPENRFALLQDVSSTTETITPITTGYNPPVVKSSNNVMPFAELQVPFYSYFHSQLITTAVKGVTTWDYDQQGSNILAYKSTLPTIDIILFRQAGEDFSMGFFLGTQRIIPLQTTARNYAESW